MKNSTPSPAQARAELTEWLIQHALPLWAGEGTDWLQGGFFEKIDARGHAIEEPRRARVVARQIFVFATASRRGWFASADRVVDHGLDFLLNVMRKPDGTFAQSVQVDGTVANGKFGLYEHAFVLFALAAAFRVKPQHTALVEVASALLQTMRRGWSHDVAGFEESNPPTLPLKSNPHMHLFEAALAWIEAAPPGAKDEWQQLADELATLCLTRFIDPSSGALREFFDHAWQAMPDRRGRVIEPGHQFEWAWLLIKWGQLRSRPDALAAARRLIHIGEAHGVDQDRGVAMNELLDDMHVLDGQAKLWPQTERIKAWNAAAEIGETDAETRAAQAKTAASIAGLSQYFMPQPLGLWYEHMALDGHFLPDLTRASSLYHIVCAIDSLHGEASQRAAESRDARAAARWPS